MGFSDTAGNFFSNMLGNVEKAIIKVVDDGKGNPDDISESAGEIRLDLETDEDAKLKSKAMRGNLDKAYSLPNITKDGGANSSIAALASNYMDNKKMFEKGKQFTVQFNPSSLKLRASGGGYSEIRNFAVDSNNADKADISLSYGTVPFSVTMEVDLVFNKVDPNDAFIEVLPSAATIKGAYKSVANLVGKNSSYSIQNEIEGLIAATRVFHTCLMSFNWGKMCYSGVLQSLNADYTVFNPKGEPVAGTVHLSMILIDEGTNELDLGKWYEAYQEAFQDPKKLSSMESSFGGSAFSNFTF